MDTNSPWQMRLPVTKHELLGLLGKYDCVPFEADLEIENEIPGLHWHKRNGSKPESPSDVMWHHVKNKTWTVKENTKKEKYVIIELDCMEIYVLQNANPNETKEGNEKVQRCVLAHMFDNHRTWKDHVAEVVKKELFHSQKNVHIGEYRQKTRDVASVLYPRLVFRCRQHLVDVEITGNMDFKNKNDLERALSRAGIPLNAFGTGRMKTVDELLIELAEGQSQLFSFAEFPNELYIINKIVAVYLQQGDKVLVETHRILKYEQRSSADEAEQKNSRRESNADSQNEEEEEGEERGVEEGERTGQRKDPRETTEMQVNEVNRLLTEPVHDRHLICMYASSELQLCHL